jgi:hypothetical protein
MKLYQSNVDWKKNFVLSKSPIQNKLMMEYFERYRRASLRRFAESLDISLGRAFRVVSLGDSLKAEELEKFAKFLYLELTISGL